MEPQWLTYAKRLQAIASTGLHFSHDPFDRERYADISAIANEMMAALGKVPIERIEGLIPDFARGYATPKVDVRGAIIENDAILLARERSDGLWTLPGGFADVGRSAARNVEKEIFEEAGLHVKAHHLYGIRHKAGQISAPDVRDFYKLFFICQCTNDSEPCPGMEISEVGFFRKDNLPPLSLSRVVASDIEAAFRSSSDEREPAFFD